mgnify:CR=1 FL=1
MVAIFIDFLFSEKLQHYQSELKMPYQKFSAYFSNFRILLVTGPDPPEWRLAASVAFFNGKLYYLCGMDPKTKEDTNRVNVLFI